MHLHFLSMLFMFFEKRLAGIMMVDFETIFSSWEWFCPIPIQQVPKKGVTTF